MRETGWASRGGLLLGLGMLPLVGLVLWLAFDQFDRQREALLAELAALSAEQHHAVEQMLQGADRQLARMRLTVEAGGPPPDGLVPVTAQVAGVTLHGTMRAGTEGALIGIPDLDPRAEGLAGALTMLDVVEMEARLGTRSHWSYFFSAAGDFITIHPHVTLGDIAGAASQPPASVADLVAYWLGYEVFRLGTPQANPERRPYWTPIYEDAGGAGPMVSHGAPVYQGGRFLGIVGTDMRLETFQEVLSHLRQPLGFLAILDAAGAVLGIDGASFAGDTDAMRAHLAAAGLTAADGPGFRRIGGDMVLSRPLAAAPFRLVHVLPVEEMNAHLLPRFIAYGWILLGLLLTMAGLLAMLHRVYIRPGFALGAWVHGQVAGQDPAPPRLPRAWRAMLDRIAGAFADSRAARDRLERSEDRYRTVVNTQTEFVVRYSPEGHPRFANDAYCRYMNVPPEDITSRAVSDFSYILPEDLPGHEAHLASLTPEQPTKGITFRSILADGSFHWEEWNDTGLFDKDGRLVEVQAVGRDITERKLAEEALRQSEKMAAMGSLLAGVAHELNNPLAIVVGYAGMLRDMAPDEATRRRAGEIQRAAERCARIVKSFLAMARARPAERVAVDVAAVIRDALELAAYGLRSNGVEVVLDAAPVPPVMADRDQIHQVFMNLILNAQQAMMATNGPRRLSIRIAAEGAAVVVTLADTGPGIEPAVQPRLFEPFFTTKPQGMGTGIGLSVCLRIVQAHGGGIRLEPGAAGGAVARVDLPMAEAAMGGDAAPPAPRLPPARVLVVDDEPGILGWISEALAAVGLTVTALNSGEDAQKALLAQDFDAVLTDLRMPGIGGERLVGFIAEHRPALLPRVLVMTGDALGAEVALGAPVAMVLEKPLDRAALLAALARVLERQAA